MITSTAVAAVSPLRVLVGDADAQSCARLAAQITSYGHVVVARAATGAEAVTRALAFSPDVALLDVHLPEGSGADAAAVLYRAAVPPAVLLLTTDDGDGLTDDEVVSTGAAAVLPKGAPGAILDSAMRLAAARGRELAGARAEAAVARRQLEERKLIERAKGILMRRTGTTEAEAYRILQRSSQDKATPMVKLAQAVLDSEPGAAPARA